MSSQYSSAYSIDTDMDADERRLEPRRSLLIRADVKMPGKSVLKAHAVDLSRGGLGLQSPMAADIDQEIEVTIPFNVCGEERKVVMTGRVRYCAKQSEQHYRIGLQFVHQDPETAAFVAAVCG